MKGIDLAGRVVVITGGARGIGRATAEALRDAGAKVAIGDIDRDEVELTAAKLGVYGAYLDVTEPYTVEGFHGTVEDELGPIEIWINNAGIMPVGPILDQDDAIIRRAVEINLLGVINGSRVAARHMAEHGGGRIVNVASVAGRVPAPGMAVYNGTKFGVVGFGEALDAELASRGVRVSTVFPSFTDTGLIEGLTLGPMVKPVLPQDIALAIMTVLRRGRRHAVVPPQLSLSTALWLHLPRPIARMLNHRAGMDQVFLHSDERRKAYDDRIRKGPKA
jgi:NAD(P)-dependent dehydrogenase (short-subunit alcohol dehydrogenase family)